MDDEEQQEQPTVRVDPEKFRQVLRAFYQVHNPARIADTPEAQSNFDTLISYYTSDVLALNARSSDARDPATARSEHEQ